MLKEAIYYLIGFSILLILLNTSIAVCQETDVNYNETNIENQRDSSSSSDSLDSIKDSNHKVIAYYFHGTRRCISCKTMEAYARETVKTFFAEELNTGQVEWKSIDYDRSEDKHYKKDYKLFASSLIISNNMGGIQTDWKNLEKVWQLKRDKAAFMKYVEAEIRGFLERE